MIKTKTPSYNSVWLYGRGGHANVIEDVLKEMDLSILGFFDDDISKNHNNDSRAKPGINSNKVGFSIPKEPILIGIGNNLVRKEIAAQLGSNFAVAISTSSLISPSTTIGLGSVVLQNTVLQANTRIGKHVIINTSASVDHDVLVEDFVHISPNSTLCGNVFVGEGTHVGAGAVILPGVSIGKWCTVGAGAVVLKNIENGQTVVGNPARALNK